MRPTNVTIWNEHIHERSDEDVAAIYPQGIHGALKRGIESVLGSGVSIRTATLDEPEHGLTEAVLADTDVLAWWGHVAHDRVDDRIVERVQHRVLAGMGLVVLHSGHFSKIFTTLMGTTCSLRWRAEDDRELVWTLQPSHPIAEGVPNPIVIPQQEMYGEVFDIPPPDELIFVSSFSGGEVFRSGCTFVRGKGRIFYFSPGDERYPVYHHEDVIRVIANGVRWVTPAQAEHRERLALRHSPIGWFEQDERDDLSGSD